MTQHSEHTYAKQTILKKAEELFMRLGVKSVSMEDIARELGVSKKTLYQLFENKEDLIFQTISHHASEQTEAVSFICSHSGDALDEILNLARNVITRMQKFSPVAIFDLKKYYPEAWCKLEKMQRDHIYRILQENLEKGIRQGIYRDDLDPGIITRIYLGNIVSLMNEALFPREEFSLDRVYREFIFYHLRGIVSAKGLKKLNALPALP